MKGMTRSALAAALLAMLLGLAPMGATAQEVAPINVNTADAELLTELPGVGPAWAAAIIEEREANGPFESAEDLTRVSGIGEATAAILEDQIAFRPPPGSRGRSQAIAAPVSRWPWYPPRGARRRHTR